MDCEGGIDSAFFCYLVQDFGIQWILKGSVTFSKMNCLGILAVCTAMVVCSCSKDDRLYTAEELHVDVEWARDGWTEVVNKTGGTVTHPVQQRVGHRV